MLNIVPAWKTDTGLVREHNEDSVLFFAPEDDEVRRQKGVLAIVADGVGGKNAGEVASSIATTIIRQTYYEDDRSISLLESFRESVQEANQQIRDASKLNADYDGMATTCTALVLYQDRAAIAHVGDSRAYMLRGDDFTQLTRDHSLANDLLAQGLITEEEAKHHPQSNVITRALGTQKDIEVDVVEVPVLEIGDCFCLCSDGLSNLVSDREISQILSSRNPLDGCEDLVDLARQRGGYDNISVLIVKVDNGPHAKGTKTKQITGPFPGGTHFSRSFLGSFDRARRLFSKRS